MVKMGFCYPSLLPAGLLQALQDCVIHSVYVTA